MTTTLTSAQAKTALSTIPLLGVALHANDTPYVADPLIAVAGGAPRVPLLSTVLLVGNAVALYAQCDTALNPGATCTLNATGTVSATTGTGQYFGMNTATAGTGDCVWAMFATSLT